MGNRYMNGCYTRALGNGVGNTLIMVPGTLFATGTGERWTPTGRGRITLRITTHHGQTDMTDLRPGLVQWFKI